MKKLNIKFLSSFDINYLWFHITPGISISLDKNNKGVCFYWLNYLVWITLK